MSNAKAKAKQILQELHIDKPELLRHLKEICVERGVYVREAMLSNSEARLTINEDRGIITVKPNRSYAARTRFSIAHELGHFELHRHEKVLLNCDQNALNDWPTRQASVKLEAEANEFASELLLPESLISKELEKNRPSIRLLESISERYQTSLSATTRRFIELTPEACAAVFFKGKFISYAWKSALFLAQGYRIEGKLHPQTNAYESASGIDSPRMMSEVRATSWFDVKEPLQLEMIQEEARFFPNLGSGMALLWINNPRLVQTPPNPLSTLSSF